MRIIVTVPYTPWPVRRGTDRLILNLLEGLSRRHEVVLVTMTLEKWELERLREIEKPRISVRAMLAPNRQSTLHRIYYKARNIAAFLFAGVPAQVSYAAPKRFLRLIADAAKEKNADLILASYWHLYRLPDLVQDTALVLVTHDLDYLVNSGRVQEAENGLDRLLISLRSRMLERIEKLAYSKYDKILTVTQSDAEVLGKHPLAEGKAVYPLPLAMDLDEFEPAAYERERNTILFTGMFLSDFNRDALRFFTDEVFPLVRRKKPGVRLELVGHGLDDGQRRRAGAGVAVIGGVDDIRPYLGRCSLMVLPLRFCGGVRIRMMEAAAMGTPVVSTHAGVAGMGLEAGSDYVEAESAGEMAEAIVGLLEDGDEARRIGSNARLWAENNISMDDYAERLDEILMKLGRAG